MSYFGIPVRNGLPIGLGSVAPLASSTSSPFSPASFFSNGEQGWWYDPSNFATLFQDSAGTTPVTAVEQPVGLQLDLSGRGNHRRQTTSANRPVVSARVNLLTKTEEGSGWQYDALTYTFYNSPVPAASAASSWGWSNGTTNYPRIGSVDAASGVAVKCRAYLWVASGTVSVRPAAYYSSAWQLLAPAFTLTSTPQLFEWSYTPSTATSFGSAFALQVVGSGDLRITATDYRVANIGVGLPTYQRVNTSTDYDSTGFPTYIKPNGSNQFMVTNSINFSGTDKMTVWQGVRKLSDATFGTLAETGTNSFSNAGSFGMVSSGGSLTSGPFYTLLGNGSSGYAADFQTYAAPITNVLTAQFDIAQSTGSTEVTLRVNSATATRGSTAGTSMGTGNFGTYPAYFYMRAGTATPFGGYDYGSIARGAASTAAQITAGETYINSLTKAY